MTEPKLRTAASKPRVELPASQQRGKTVPAPNNPNTSAATAAVVRRGQETMAAKLRAAGWMCIPPEQLAPPAWVERQRSSASGY